MFVVCIFSVVMLLTRCITATVVITSVTRRLAIMVGNVPMARSSRNTGMFSIMSTRSILVYFSSHACFVTE